jgi:hypothetical protein
VFAKASQQYWLYTGYLSEQYRGGGIRAIVGWTSSAAGSGNVVWSGEFDRLNSGASLDTPGYATAQTTTTAVPGTNGNITYTTISFTNSQIDSLAAGNFFRFRLSRVSGSGSDTYTAGSAQMVSLALMEV